MTASRRALPSRLEGLDDLADFVDACARESRVPDARLVALRLLVEEAFVNVCSYAYPGGEGPVEVTCEAPDGRFVLEVADRGLPFDVLAVPTPDVTLDVDARRVGGLGVLFIRTFSDVVSYRREGDRNVLRLELHLP